MNEYIKIQLKLGVVKIQWHILYSIPSIHIKKDTITDNFKYSTVLEKTVNTKVFVTSLHKTDFSGLAGYDQQTEQNGKQHEPF